jgi:hypothetical protein
MYQWAHELERRLCMPRTDGERYLTEASLSIRDAVDDNMEEKMTKAQDFKSSCNRSLHSRYD